MQIRRETASLGYTKARVLIPRMAPEAAAVCAAMQAAGVDAMLLPPADQTNLVYSNRVTSGKECLPYRVVLGDFLRFFYEQGKDVSPESVEGFMPTAYGPCRFGKYAPEQSIQLREVGFPLPLRTVLSNEAYQDAQLGKKFERMAWKGVVAIDQLEKLTWRTRPYEKIPGSADELFDNFVALIAERIRSNKTYDDVLKRAVGEFNDLVDRTKPKRPLVGINGEIFLRSNSFSNNNLVKVCEDAGLEVVVSPFSEWIKYVTHRHVEDAIRDRKIRKILQGYIRSFVTNRDEKGVLKRFGPLLDGHEPSIKEILSLSEKYLSPKCGSEAVLSLGTGIEWLENPKFAGVISVMPHGCMPGGIVAAMADGLSAKYRKPWISVTYDGFMETNNLVKINNFAEILRYCSDGHGRNPSIARS
jgi:predicted nucleotide-binding protein (sugar kinase/HSP70/actin superfamily)